MFSTALILKSNSFISQVKPYNIAVSVVFPPDTDTPGFENENKNKVICSSSHHQHQRWNFGQRSDRWLMLMPKTSPACQSSNGHYDRAVFKWLSVIPPNNHSRSKQRDEPIRIPREITYNLLKEREKSRLQGAIGFGFASRWLRFFSQSLSIAIAIGSFEHWKFNSYQ